MRLKADLNCATFPARVVEPSVQRENAGSERDAAESRRRWPNDDFMHAPSVNRRGIAGRRAINGRGPLALRLLRGSSF